MLFHCLWRNIDGIFSSSIFSTQLVVDDTSHTYITNFRPQGTIEQDIPWSEVLMDDGWRLAVKIEQSSGNIEENPLLGG